MFRHRLPHLSPAICNAMKRPRFPVMAGTCMALFSLMFVSCQKESPAQDATTRPERLVNTEATYQLVWEDQFDGSSVDQRKWNFENGNLHVNNEKQYYQASNASVTGGNLVITARKQSVEGQPYTSARLNTSGKFSIKYGRIEARIRMSSGQGLWPAFWMLGANIGQPGVGWPKCGEIDIMEQVNTSNTIYGTIHW